MNRYEILIPGEDVPYYIRFQKQKCISIFTSFCVIRAYKSNPHSYYLRMFMYFSKSIFCRDRLTSKDDLITHIRYYISLEKDLLSVRR